jgi:hypothetical protein
MKIIVSNTSNSYKVFVNNEEIGYKEFLCVFMNLEGTVKQFMKIVELK